MFNADLGFCLTSTANDALVDFLKIVDKLLDKHALHIKLLGFIS